jgi:hypothetical protein
MAACKRSCKRYSLLRRKPRAVGARIGRAQRRARVAYWARLKNGCPGVTWAEGSNPSAWFASGLRIRVRRFDSSRGHAGFRRGSGPGVQPTGQHPEVQRAKCRHRETGVGDFLMGACESRADPRQRSPDEPDRAVRYVVLALRKVRRLILYQHLMPLWQRRGRESTSSRRGTSSVGWPSSPLRQSPSLSPAMIRRGSSACILVLRSTATATSSSGGSWF